MTTNLYTTPTFTLGVVIAYVILILVYLIPISVIYWNLFKKAGQAGWKYIVPIYGQYTMGVISDSPTLGFAAGLIWVLYYINTLARTFSVSVPEGYTIFISFAWIASSLVLLVKFIRAYDAGIGRWILFVFFPIIGVFFVNKVNYKDASNQAPSTPKTIDVPTSAEQVQSTTAVDPVATPAPAPEQPPAQSSDTTTTPQV